MHIRTSTIYSLTRNVNILKLIKIPCIGTDYYRKPDSQRGEPTLFSIQGSDKDSQNKDECWYGLRQHDCHLSFHFIHSIKP